MEPEPLVPLTKRRLRGRLTSRLPVSIDDDLRMYHLPSRYWVYDEMLAALREAGWVRFAAGFKAGLYGRPGCGFCLKVLGMGVGENPLYFAERGYYLEHERRMLERFRAAGYTFGPAVLPPDETIKLLRTAGVSEAQAELRVAHDDVLAMEHINGIPLASQTGRFLNYELGIADFCQELLGDVLVALEELCRQLDKANTDCLLHNDPMPPQHHRYPRSA